jgi:uncharacterized protein (TIGR02001 family)
MRMPDRARRLRDPGPLTPAWRAARPRSCSACAQAAPPRNCQARLSAVSDYRYRGITFSDLGPAAQAGLTYDDPKGWYAGAFGSTVRLAPPGRSNANFQAIVYAGYATRLPSGITVEAGGDYSAFAGSSDLNYGEVFIGGAIENLNARFYYAPRYFGQAPRAIYGEINATQPLIDRVGLHVHAGFLRYSYDSPYLPLYGIAPTHNVVDGRIGLRADLDVVQVEIAWVGVSNHAAAYQITGRRSPNGVVAAVSFSF